MKEIKFTKLEIKNFRGVNELEINFNEKTTEILASNGKGKTTTLSAIMWVLFGKDINDNKQFVISPIIDGVEDNSLYTSVKLVINDNYVIERSYKDRKTEMKTGYIIDGKEQLVSITQTKFKEELIENLIDEETFKSLSNINYIPNLHWKELKKLIFELIGDIKDTEVLLRDDFSLIEEYITKFGSEQTQKLLSETDKELNEDIKRLETEYQTLFNTKEKYVANSEQNKELELRKQEIEKDLYSSEEKQIEYNENKSIYDNFKQEIFNLEYQVKKIENDIVFNTQNINDYENLYKQHSYNVEDIRNKETREVEQDIENSKRNITRIELDIKEKQQELENNKQQGIALKQQEIKVENDICNACGQPLPEEKIQSTLNNLKEIQHEELLKLKSKYDGLKEELLELAKQQELNEKSLEVELKKLEIVKTKEYENVGETEKQKQIRIVKEEKELANINLNKELLNKKSQFETKQKEFSLLEEPSVPTINNEILRIELNDINNKLATTITLNKISEDVEKTLEKLNNAKDNKISNKEKINQVIKFNNVKADLLQQKVRVYFDEVNFITKEFTNDGTEQETFKIANSKRIEWKDINAGHKILLGIDLLQGVMKAKNLFVPILVDSGEVLTNDVKLDNTQLIITKAVKGIEKLEVK